jgi:hypothetical protein
MMTARVERFCRWLAGETDLDDLGRRVCCLRHHFVFPFLAESDAAYADRLTESIARLEQAEAIKVKWREIFPDFDAVLNEMRVEKNHRAALNQTALK